MDKKLKEIIELAKIYLMEESSPIMQEEMRNLLTNPSLNINELEDRLTKNLEFGTAGLRALMESGYNRMNLVSSFRLGFAISEYFKILKASPTLVIGYDGRLNSADFAHEIHEVLSRQEFTIKFFKEPVPTPLCAFATKFYKADMGIMVTASHNPKNYNGTKIFSSSGMQLDRNILLEIQRLMKTSLNRKQFYEHYQVAKKINFIDDRLFDEYFASIKESKFFPSNKKVYDEKIVYTALHGVGEKFFRRALNEEGFNQIYTVEKQSRPDGNFPTLSFPNPEELHTLDEAYAYALENKISYVFANDPDADRLQVALLNKSGCFEKLNGNQMGVLLGYFAMKKAIENGITPIVASSVVSSRMLKKMAIAMNAIYLEALTGFGNIAAKAMHGQNQGKGTFVFAYEEAIGFLVGQTVLDKDGISVSVRFMEIISYLKEKNQTIDELLLDLASRFGLFLTSQWSIMFEGLEAKNKIDSIMQKARSLSTEDFSSLTNIKDVKKFDLKINNLESEYANMISDMIIFENEKIRFIIRPSGTEPKIKFYLELIENCIVQDVLLLKEKNMRTMNEIQSSLQKILG